MTVNAPQRPLPSAARVPLHEAHPEQAGAIGGLSDVALAVVVGTLTLVGVIGFFQTSSSGARTNAEVANFTSLISNIRSAYWQGGSNFSGISATNLASSHIAPEPLINATADDLTSMFGGDVDVAVNTTNNFRFDVTYNGLPEDACVKMITTTAHTLSGIATITVGTTDLTPPVTMAQAAGVCSSASQNVTWVLDR
jgi:hypothetical protein